eukprot:6502357-Prymnesium_polylepis.1
MCALTPPQKPAKKKHTRGRRAGAQEEPPCAEGHETSVEGGARGEHGDHAQLRAEAAHVLRVAKAEVEREAVAPRHGRSELEAIVDAVLADGGVDGGVEHLAEAAEDKHERPLRSARLYQRRRRVAGDDADT